MDADDDTQTYVEAACNVTLGVVAADLAASMLAKAHYTDLGMLGNFSFLGNKYEPSWFFWESTVIARSVGLLLAFFVFEGQDSWLAATALLLSRLR